MLSAMSSANKLCRPLEREIPFKATLSLENPVSHRVQTAVAGTMSPAQVLCLLTRRPSFLYLLWFPFSVILKNIFELKPKTL